MLDSVRARLALWYVSILALVLIAFSVSVYALIASTLYKQLDADLHVSVESAALTFVDEVVAKHPLREAAHQALNELSTLDASAVFTSTGELISEEPAQGDVHVSLPPQGNGPLADFYFDTVTTDGIQRRVIARRVNVPPSDNPYFIVISRSFESVDLGLQKIRLILYLAVPGALIFSALGGWFLSRRSLASVVYMSDRARKISAENLSQRLPVANPRDELGKLAGTFNELLARLDTSFTQQRRFMADASHELRTPLSVIRTSAEVTLGRENRDEPEYRDALKIIDEQVKRLSHIVEDMFTLSRADVGRRVLTVTDFYLDELILETARAATILGARKGIRIETPTMGEIPFRGDEGLLRQMLLNLLDNAVKYTPAEGFVRVKVEESDAHHRILVEDSGLGIPEREQELIFERFYRVDKARSGTAESDGWGAGLGLSIAKWIAQAHGGDLVLQRSDDTGSTFRVTLPLHSS